MPIGAGFVPAGTTAAGFGIPDAPASIPQAAPLDSVLIDAVLGDYVYDATGNRTQTTRAHQMVYLVVATVQGSSADTELGLERAPAVILDSYVEQRSQMYQRGFSSLERLGVAKLVSVEIVRNTPTQVVEVVRWQDLTTSTIHTVNI